MCILEVALRLGIPLVGGEVLQPCCLGMVLRDPDAVHPDLDFLRRAVPLIGGEAARPCCCDVVLCGPGTNRNLCPRGCTVP